MVSDLFLGIALLGGEWVLYILVLLSILSVAVIIERWAFYKKARTDLDVFRSSVRTYAQQKDWRAGLEQARQRQQKTKTGSLDFESDLACVLLSNFSSEKNSSLDSLSEVAQDSILRTRLAWDRNLAILATIGNNAPFIGLFGTVLGVIQAMHHLSEATNAGAQTVTAGISEALIATAAGIFVAIPAVVAFNIFNRKVRSALAEAEAFKSFLIGNYSSQKG